MDRSGTLTKVATFAAFAWVLVACGASKPPPAEPAQAASPPPAQQPQGGYPGYAPAGSAQAQPGYPAQPLTPGRQASADFDKAQRELEVAAGDCTNACRALSSMDRAAGRICTLVSGSEEDTQRCADAKSRVYSARDKVKSTCGTCEGTSVERNAPVPSTR